MKRPVTVADFDAMVAGFQNADPALADARRVLNARHHIDMCCPEYRANYARWVAAKAERDGPGAGRGRRRPDFDQDLHPTK